MLSAGKVVRCHLDAKGRGLRASERVRARTRGIGHGGGVCGWRVGADTVCGESRGLITCCVAEGGGESVEDAENCMFVCSV